MWKNLTPLCTNRNQDWHFILQLSSCSYFNTHSECCIISKRHTKVISYSYSITIWNSSTNSTLTPIPYPSQLHSFFSVFITYWIQLEPPLCTWAQGSIHEACKIYHGPHHWRKLTLHAPQDWFLDYQNYHFMGLERFLSQQYDCHISLRICSIPSSFLKVPVVLAPAYKPSAEETKWARFLGLVFLACSHLVEDPVSNSQVHNTWG